METLENLNLVCKNIFIEHFQRVPAFISHAPGRINIIGEHTDYNQGLAMPCAINQWVSVAMSPTSDQRIRVFSSNFNEEMAFELTADYQPKSIWEQYVHACILLFNKTFRLSGGLEAVIHGNVPIGSGVSSSAALEVAFVNALNQLSNAGIDPLTLIRLCQQVEHQYLHVKSGLLDQYASQFSKAGKLMILDFQDQSHTYIPADLDQFCWILCDTKVKRTLAGSKYSERVEETKAALTCVQHKDPLVKEFRHLQEEHLEWIEDPILKKRIRHYLRENQRVILAATALEKNDVVTLGKIITTSHYSLKNAYEVSCEELDFLVNEALESNICLGSRMMGGGFGGCTINLVARKNAEAFGDIISEAYRGKFDISTEINCYTAVDGAGISICSTGNSTG